MPLSNLTNIRWLTFDCYGTLIDWQTGLLAAAQPIFRALGVTMPDADLIRRFGEIEREMEKPPYRPYRDVLERTLEQLAGRPLSPDQRPALWQSIADWPAFPEVPPTLARLQQRFKLAVLSNIDDDLFAASHARLGIRLDELVTAQQVRSYKPARAHFDEFLRRTNVKPGEVLHVAESRFHDIEPAAPLGFRTCWINRTGDNPSASGVPSTLSRHPDLIVHNLTELADLLLRT